MERDPAETRDLASALPEKSTELAARLTGYLKAVVAQMAAPNPNHDPSKAPDPAANEPRERRGGKGGKGGNQRE